MTVLGATFFMCWVPFVMRVAYGRGSPIRGDWLLGCLGLIGLLILASAVPVGAGLALGMATAGMLVYVAFTVWVSEGFVRWSISTRVRTGGLSRDYPTTRLWRIPGPVFRFLARHRSSVTVGLLLPQEREQGRQLGFRE